MPITRKRKAVSPEPSKQSTTQKTISSYGRVTKGQTINDSAKKRKVLDPVVVSTASPSQSPPSNQQEESASNTKSTSKTSRKRTRESEEEEETVTPQNKRFRNALPPTPAETPSKGASKLFEKLNIETTSSNPTTNKQEEVAYDTPPLTPRSFKSLGAAQTSTELPPPIQDLVRLFSSLLTSTSLFCAHHGVGAPLYLDTLLPNVTKAWKKRAVNDHDIRVLLAIIGLNNLPFELADNGEGNLCLEILNNNKNSTPGHFNQPELIQRFQQQLTKLWNDWTFTSQEAKRNVDGFLQQLPECPVVTSELAPSNTSGTSRGRERLNDLKSGAVLARAAETASRKPVVKAESRTAAAVSSRGSSLLDRILAKQQANSTKESGPNQEELDRKAALDRVEEISRVLDLLANGRPRASFSTQAIVSHLQTSLRNPISAQEVERCLNLMANEVSPGFVSMIQVGQVRGIVITRVGKLSDAEFEKRLVLARGTGC